MRATRGAGLLTGTRRSREVFFRRAFMKMYQKVPIALKSAY
jgi:hypothetical protein